MKDKMIKLHLGCGDNILKGYVNVDLYNQKADLKHDLLKDLPYEEKSVDEIYSSHVIEHFTRQQWNKVKKDWCRVLKIGGKLVIECPDIVRCMERFIDNSKGKKWSKWIQTIYGGQEEFGKGQLHKNGFDLDKLKKDLAEEGMNVIKHYYLYDAQPQEDGFNIRVEAIKCK